MNRSYSRLAVASVLALGVAGLSAPSFADSEPLGADAVGALALAQCPSDPEAAVDLAELAPVVLGEADVDVVLGELARSSGSR